MADFPQMIPYVFRMGYFFYFLLFLVPLQQIPNRYHIHCNAINNYDNDTKNMIAESIMIKAL